MDHEFCTDTAAQHANPVVTAYVFHGIELTVEIKNCDAEFTYIKKVRSAGAELLCRDNINPL